MQWLSLFPIFEHLLWFPTRTCPHCTFFFTLWLCILKATFLFLWFFNFFCSFNFIFPAFPIRIRLHIRKCILRIKGSTICFYQRSGNAVLGLPYALASLSFCQSFNLDLLRASAVLTMAELWLSLGSNHAKRALSLIHGVLPTILGHGGLELRARAYIVEVKCYLSDPNFSGMSVSNILLNIAS